MWNQWEVTRWAPRDAVSCCRTRTGVGNVVCPKGMCRLQLQGARSKELELQGRCQGFKPSLAEVGEDRLRTTQLLGGADVLRVVTDRWLRKRQDSIAVNEECDFHGEQLVAATIVWRRSCWGYTLSCEGQH